MNYQIIKMLLESLVSNFRCPNCQSQVGEGDIEIIGAAGTTLNIDVSCNSCQKHTFIKAEVAHIDAENMQTLSANDVQNMKHHLKNHFSSIRSHSKRSRAQLINEKEILHLRKKFQDENFCVNDLFGE